MILTISKWLAGFSSTSILLDIMFGILLVQEFQVLLLIQHPKISGLTPVQQGPRFVGVSTAVISRMIAPLVGNPYKSLFATVTG